MTTPTETTTRNTRNATPRTGANFAAELRDERTGAVRQLALAPGLDWQQVQEYVKRYAGRYEVFAQVVEYR